MLRRLPPVVQFIFVSMIGVCIGTIAGLVNEFFQKPFSAANALIWLFLLLISSVIIGVIIVFGRNGFR